MCYLGCLGHEIFANSRTEMNSLIQHLLRSVMFLQYNYVFLLVCSLVNGYYVSSIMASFSVQAITIRYRFVNHCVCEKYVVDIWGYCHSRVTHLLLFQ